MQLCHTKCNPLSGFHHGSYTCLRLACAFPGKKVRSALHFLLHTRGAFALLSSGAARREKKSSRRGRKVRAFLTQMKDYYDFQFLCVRACASACLPGPRWMDVFLPFAVVHVRGRAFCNFYSAGLFSLFFFAPQEWLALCGFYIYATLLAHSLFLLQSSLCVFHLILCHE